MVFIQWNIYMQMSEVICLYSITQNGLKGNLIPHIQKQNYKVSGNTNEYVLIYYVYK